MKKNEYEKIYIYMYLWDNNHVSGSECDSDNQFDL